jgi:hypothetical protein
MWRRGGYASLEIRSAGLQVELGAGFLGPGPVLVGSSLLSIDSPMVGADGGDEGAQQLLQ